MNSRDADSGRRRQDTPGAIAGETPSQWPMPQRLSASATPIHVPHPGANHGTPTLAEVPAELAHHTRYEILERLGAGGMGTVYKARHKLMNRLVALKVVHPHLLDHPEIVARFRREMQAAARLHHPNVVAAYDADQAGAARFLVMELVQGVNLHELLRQHGKLPIGLACGYALQVACGLEHAHAHGMVHRDIKPHNLMLTPQGVVKILDFGLSRVLTEAAAAHAQVPGRAAGPRAPRGEPPPPRQPGEEPATGARRRRCDSGVTSAYAALGTADYIAPEEAIDARRADIRADIYSLGCTLYRFLSGEVPFPGGDCQDKIERHLAGTPTPLAAFRDDLPARLVEVVGRMMHKDVSDRYQTPRAVVDALAPFALHRGRHILIVEDEPDARATIAAVLAAEGFEVAVAANGREALDCLRAGQAPGLILLDLIMPVMSGWQFLSEQRRDPQIAHIPVIVLSAKDPAEVRAIAQGAVDYLQKPVDPGDLAERVQQFTRAGDAATSGD